MRHTGILTSVLPAPHGSTLLLDDGHKVRIDLTPDDLIAFLDSAGISSQSIDSLPSLRVTIPALEITTEEWSTIASVLKSAEVAAAIRAFPELDSSLSLSYEELVALSYRVLGNIQREGIVDLPTIWVRHPFEFRCHRDGTVRMCHLYARGGHVFRTFIDTQTRAIHVTPFLHRGFFVEPRCAPNA